MDKTLINDDITCFVKYARQFCSLVEDSNKYELTDFAGKSLEVLSGLYNSAIRLPFPDSRSDNLPPKLVTTEQKAKICSEIMKKFGDYSFYQEVDPYGKDEKVGGTILGDDFADIYADIKNSLVLFDKGGQENITDAIWQWKHDFMSHWGYHLINALKAIHYYYFWIYVCLPASYSHHYSFGSSNTDLGTL